MKVTIEEINGKQYTIIWYCSLWDSVRQLENMEEMTFISIPFGWVIAEYDYLIAIALLPLPRNPEPKHAQLLYSYMSNGLYPVTSDGIMSGICPIDNDFGFNVGWVGESIVDWILHCVDKNKNKVEVAIDE